MSELKLNLGIVWLIAAISIGVYGATYGGDWKVPFWSALIISNIWASKA